jgi:hypothetical protein
MAAADEDDIELNYCGDGAENCEAASPTIDQLFELSL